MSVWKSPHREHNAYDGHRFGISGENSVEAVVQVGTDECVQGSVKSVHAIDAIRTMTTGGTW